MQRSANEKAAEAKKTHKKTETALHDLLDAISHDMYCIGINHHFANGTQHFYALLESAYQLGGWPNGWIEDYPEGNLVV